MAIAHWWDFKPVVFRSIEVVSRVKSKRTFLLNLLVPMLGVPFWSGLGRPGRFVGSIRWRTEKSYLKQLTSEAKEIFE